MCSVFIIYRREDSRNAAAINFFVNIRSRRGGYGAQTKTPCRPVRAGREKPEIQIPGTALQPCRERLREYEEQKVTARRALRALRVLS